MPNTFSGQSGFEPGVDSATRRALFNLSRRIDSGSVTDPLLLSDGTALAPSFSFTSTPSTGMFVPAANQLGFSAGGTTVLQLATTDVDVTTGHLNVISNTGSPTIKIGEWSNTNWNLAAIETDSSVILMGSGGVNDDTYIRSKGTGRLYLGTYTVYLTISTTDVDVTTGHLNVISNTGSPTIKIGGWSALGNHGAIETVSAYILMGYGGVDNPSYIRTKGTGTLNLGTNNTDYLTIDSAGTVRTVGHLNVGGRVDVTSYAVATQVIATANDNNNEWWARNFRAGGGTLARTGIAFWNGTTAPQIYVNPGATNDFLFLNSNAQSWAHLYAGAFVVSSQEATKYAIEETTDERMLDVAAKFKPRRYKIRDKQQVMRPSKKFRDINTRRQAKGRTALVPPVAELSYAEHDCDIDECCGGGGKVCSSVLNDTYHFGSLAEDAPDLGEEIVMLGDEGEPVGLDVAQLATVALGGVGALDRKLTLAMETIAELQDRLAVLEQVQ